MDRETFAAFIGVTGFILAVTSGAYLLVNAPFAGPWKVLILGVALWLLALCVDRV